jgi:hypothetical protein
LVSDDERFEQLIAFLGSQLPPPVDLQTAGDGSMVFTGGIPEEVVVHLTATTVTVSEYAGVWESPGRFVVTPRHVGRLEWHRLPEVALMHALSALIKGARETRLARYRLCAVCDQPYPPEALVADDICPGCSGAPDVVVH